MSIKAGVTRFTTPGVPRSRKGFPTKAPPRSSQDETKRGWKITAINSIFFTPKSATGVMSAFRNTSRNNRRKHAEVLMECILFLDGTPTMKPLDLTIGKNVQEM